MPKADVLVVDDSMSARFALTRSLQPHGLNIEAAKSAEEALEVVSRTRFDMIFMDHVLPGMTGLDAAEKIRGMPEYADTPIIMCSSNEGEDYVQEAHRRGATDVIGKPPVDTDLNRVVEQYLKASAEEPATELATEPDIAAAPELEQASAVEMTTPAEPAAPAAFEEAPSMNEGDKMADLDARIDRIEKMLEKLEASVAQIQTHTEAVARSVADKAGRDLANRLLRAVVTLKGPGK